MNTLGPDYAYMWFENLGRGKISSIANLIKDFRKYWNRSYEEEQVEDLVNKPCNVHATFDTCHEKNNKIQDIMLLLHNNP